MQCGRW